MFICEPMRYVGEPTTELVGRNEAIRPTASYDKT